ncbi:hypothetical protein M514_05379 [Trichuris suis]|nr:hypothetical protein M514_05379 [Trichuris suis]
MALGTAAKLIGQLEAVSDEGRVKILENINNMVDVLWPEISLLMEKIEEWAADKSFEGSKIASLIASKVHYYSGSDSDALIYALQAQDIISLEEQSDYVVAITSQALLIYTAWRNENVETFAELENRNLHEDLICFINKAFDCFIRSRRYYQTVGIAVDARRNDILKRILDDATIERQLHFICYCVDVVTEFAPTVATRKDMLLAIVKRIGASRKTYYSALCKALKHLEDPQCLFDFLVRFTTASERLAVMAYQLAIDVYAGAPLIFLQQVGRLINRYAQEKVKLVSLQKTVDQKRAGFSMLRLESPKKILQRSFHEISNDKDRVIAQRLYRLDRIVRGYLHVWLYRDLYTKNCHIDFKTHAFIMENASGSEGYTSSVIAFGLMSYGTGLDNVLRMDAKWMSTAKYWSSFVTVASLGLTFHGHDEKAMQKINEYLPRETLKNNIEYLQGGAYYALGLAFAHRGLLNIMNYLIIQLGKYDSPVLQHGACLGLGLAGMCTHDLGIYGILKNALVQNDVIVGLAASLAMGLVMAGSNNYECVMELVRFGASTRHEKILHGISVAIGMIAFGHAEEANTWIGKLSVHANPFIRMASVFGLAMAYCGSGNTTVTNQLLQISVSDGQRNVRRVAVICIGFIMARRPDHCIQLVSRMTKSCDPHVRYGAAMAMGIACAGTASKDAVSLLLQMIPDETSFVRQGVFIALSMVYMQCNETMDPKALKFRRTLLRAISEDGEDPLAKFGATIGCGIIDAAGSTATISIYEGADYVSTPAAIGLLVFVHMWFWYPLGHFLSLALQPTCIIGINPQLKMPRFSFVSKAPVGVFATPKPVEIKIRSQAGKLPSLFSPQPSVEGKMVWKKPLGELADKSEDEDKEKTMEEESEKVNTTTAKDYTTHFNPARVVRQQLAVMEMPKGCRYKPFKDIRLGGIVVMHDEKPGNKEDLVATTTITLDSDDDEGPRTPDSFDYSE